MDIEVLSGHEDKLRISQCEKLGDEGHKCKLDLVSGSFAAETEFWFDIESTNAVISVLRNFIEEPRGNAKLSFRYEEPFIQFSGDGLGHIDVVGLLTEGPPFQRLEFTFRTDQTMIEPLLSGLEELLNAP